MAGKRGSRLFLAQSAVVRSQVDIFVLKTSCADSASNEQTHQRLHGHFCNEGSYSFILKLKIVFA